MNITAKIWAILIILAASSLNAAGQRIKFVRSDVDSTRSGFVTAKYIFGLDIYIDSVTKCNNVDFLLQYNQIDYVKYNGYEVGALGKSGSSSVITKLNPLLDQGTISVVVLAGSSPELDSMQNTHVIHLEFAVTQSAPHDNHIIFNFVDPIAVIATDSGRTAVNLNFEQLDLKIHSFVEVWPGDANNDGNVDHTDGAAIAQYVSLDPTVNHKRSFKRENAGTRWAAQRVLAWDIDGATYADCDGNGYVTITDVLIVYLNHDSTHIVIPKTKDGEIPQSPANDSPFYRNDETIAIPIKASSNQAYIGAAGKIYLDGISQDFDYVGMEKGGLFDCDKCYIYQVPNVETNSVEFAVGKFNRAEPVTGSGTIAWLIMKPKYANLQPEYPIISGLTGITPGGFYIPLYHITSVENPSDENTPKPYVKYEGNQATIFNLNSEYSSIRVFNSIGSELPITSITANNSQTVLQLGYLSQGAYYILINNKYGTKALPFCIAR